MKIVNISPTTSLHIYLHKKEKSYDEWTSKIEEDEEFEESAIYNLEGFYKDAAKDLLDSFQKKYCDKFLIELINILQEKFDKSNKEREAIIVDTQ